MPSDAPPPPPPGRSTPLPSDASSPTLTSASAPPHTGPPTPIEPPRRLHPFSVVRGIEVRGLIGTAAGLFVIGNDVPFPVLVGLLGLGFVLTAVVRVLSWRQHTYELTAERVVERRGIVRRDERTLELARIQQVDVHRTILDRMVGTAELRLETAADSGDSEIRLAVVTVEEADRLRDRLATATSAAREPFPGSRRTTEPPTDDEPTTGPWPPPTRAETAGPAQDQVLVEVPLAHVALAAVTGRRLLLLPAGLAVLFGLVDDFGLFDDVEERVGEATLQVGLLGAVGVALAIAAVGVVAAVVAALLRDGNWTLTTTDTAFRVARGLTDQRTATVPHGRVQAVSVQRSWIRRALGFATVTVRSAGGSRSDPGATAQLDQELTVPLLPEGDVAALVQRLLGTSASDTPKLEPHPVAARRRAVVVGMLGAAGPALACAVVAVLAWAPVGHAVQVVGLSSPQLVLPLMVAAVALLAAGAWTGLLRYRRRATGVGDVLLVARTGLLGTTTVHVPRRKVQGTGTVTTPFQRRRGLSSLEVYVAGPSGGVHVLDLDADDAARMRRDLVRTVGRSGGA